MSGHSIASLIGCKVAVVAILVLAIAGCETGYQPGHSSVMGGYDSAAKDYNVFHVWYYGNAFVTEDKASDLVLARAAELTLKHGFAYLAVAASEVGAGPLGKPHAQVVIGCFRQEPKHARSAYDIHDAAALLEEMAAKHDLKHHGQPLRPERAPFTPDPDVIRFDVAPWYIGEPILTEDVEYVVRDSSTFDMDGTWVGRYADFENPVVTTEAFVEAARPLAALSGANGILIEADPARIHGNARYEDIEEPLIGFVADLYVVPVASLGIEWEPGDMLLGKYVIRRFRAGSQAAEAGLMLGDKVLAINGVDVLETNELLQQSMTWQVGEAVKLTVVRDGRETVIDVPLVPNMVVQQ
jgi:hypothetical protein